MTIDERIEALTMNLELFSHQQEAQGKRIEMLITAVEKLVLVAQSHERRLTELEGGS